MSFALGEIAAINYKWDIFGFIWMSLLVMFLIYKKYTKNLLCILLLGAYALGSINMNAYQKDIEKIRDEIGKTVTICGEIQSVKYTEKQVRIIIEDSLIYMNTEEEQEGLHPGGYIKASGTVENFEVARNEGNYNEKTYYYSQGILRKISCERVEVLEKKNSIRTWLYYIQQSFEKSLEKVWNPSEVAYIKAMTVGDTQSLSTEQKEKFRVSGLSHLLVVSGLHLSLLCLGMYRLLRRRLATLPASVVAISLGISYGILVGNTTSVKRALIMFGIQMLAGIFGRTYDMGSALGIAGILLMLENPGVLMSTGFLLSVGAVTGIAITALVSRHSALVLLGIQALTLPITLWSYYEYSVYGIVVNLLEVPLMTGLLLSGFVTGILGYFCVPLARFLAGLGHLVLWIYVRTGKVVEQLPGHSIVTGRPEIWKIIIYLLGIFCIFVIGIRKKKEVLIPLCILPMLCLILYGKRMTEYVAMFDVGQGDSILLHIEEGNYLIDCGSSSKKQLYEYTLSSALKAKGIACLDGVILTHLDNDHINGCRELLEANMTKKLYVSVVSYKEEKFQELYEVAMEHGISIQCISSGMNITKKGTLCCLFPEDNETVNGEQEGQGIDKSDDKNENSVVLSLEIDGYKFLFTGDLGEKGEGLLLSELEQYQVLKVGHHGSKNSSSQAFLEKIKPEIALISCGENNRYGHPHTEAIQNLEMVGSTVYRTDKMGELDVEVRRNRLRVRGYLD